MTFIETVMLVGDNEDGLKLQPLSEVNNDGR